MLFEELPGLIPCRLSPPDLRGQLGVSAIDSRLLRRGDLFWALSGEHIDGHDFVQEAFSKGARVAVVGEAWYAHQGAQFPYGAFVIVPDTLKALQNLGRAQRQRSRVPLIAITGSNGKTSTKELFSAALAIRYRVLKSAGNFNNHIGLPLTLLQITSATEIIITEMGTNHPGEIEFLCSLALPTAGMVLNVGPAHLEGFGDLESVAREKAVLLASLPESGAAFLNLDDAYVRQMRTSARTRIGYAFSARGTKSCTSTLRGKKLPPTPEGCGVFRLEGTTFRLNWPGEHQLSNALAAAAAAQHFQIPPEIIAEAFAHLPPIKGRLQVTSVAGISIIDDSYNANPVSTAAALEFLSSLPVSGQRFAVLGDNLELGASSEAEHRKLGKLLARNPEEQVYLIGREMRYAFQECMNLHKSATYFDPDVAALEQIIGILITVLQPGDAIMVKASRGMGLERVVQGLSEYYRREK